MKVAAGKKVVLLDSFSKEPVKWTINESLEVPIGTSVPGKVDGINVLARVRGEGFLYGGISDNQRMYLKELWDRQIVEKRSELNDGGIFGAFGHEQPLGILDLGAGMASHLVTDFCIEDGKGIVEYIVLNTPTGRNLNTYLRAGKRMAISSRGFGEVLEVTANGVEVINPRTFFLKTFDIVEVPGVPSAFPELVESKTTPTVTKLEVKKMDPETVQQLLKLNEEKSNANNALNEALREKAVLISERDAAKALNENYKQVVGDIDQARALHEGILKWMIFEPFKKFAQQTGMGGLFQPGKGLAEISPIVEGYAKLGDLESVKAKCEAHDKYASLGKYENVKSVCEAADQYGKLGKFEVLQRMVKGLSKVKKRVNEGKRKRLLKEASKKLNESFPNVSVERITPIISTMKAVEAVKTIKGLNEALATPTGATPAAKTTPVTPVKVNGASTPTNESGTQTKTMQQRLTEQMGAKNRI